MALFLSPRPPLLPPLVVQGIISEKLKLKVVRICLFGKKDLEKKFKKMD